MANYLFVEATGGLANRLMCLLSGMRIARRLDRRLVMIRWAKDESLYANLTDLFETPIEHDMVKPTAFDIHFGHSSSILVMDDNNIKGKDIFIEGAHHFFYLMSDFERPRPVLAADIRNAFWSLELVPYIAQQVALYEDGLQNGLGLHIRRSIAAELNSPDTHNHPEINRVWARPDDASYAQLAEHLVLQANLTGKVFVSTVSDATRSYIVERLGTERVKFFPARSYAHDESSASIQDALVDMLLLSRTRLITRRNPSTYPYLASILGGCPQVVIYDDGQLAIKEHAQW